MSLPRSSVRCNFITRLNPILESVRRPKAFDSGRGQVFAPSVRSAGGDSGVRSWIADPQQAPQCSSSPIPSCKPLELDLLPGSDAIAASA